MYFHAQAMNVLYEKKNERFFQFILTASVCMHI